VEQDKPTKLESVGQTATVAMETKKGGFNFFLEVTSSAEIKF
jgi:hypothetical protein